MWITAYGVQQDVLRAEAGLPAPTRDKDGWLVDTPETVAAIRELHRRELKRRRESADSSN